MFETFETLCVETKVKSNDWDEADEGLAHSELSKQEIDSTTIQICCGIIAIAHGLLSN